MAKHSTPVALIPLTPPPVLSEEDLAALRAAVGTHGLNAIADLVGVSRNALANFLAGSARRGTGALLKFAMPTLRSLQPTAAARTSAA